MVSRPLRRRFTAWIAMFAVLLGALAPTVSQAVSWVSGGDIRWAEVCTAAGIRLVAADFGGQDEPADGQAGFGTERCPYCGTHAGSFGLPPVPVPDFHLPVVPDRVPAFRHVAPRPLVAWAAAQSRAPPVLS